MLFGAHITSIWKMGLEMFHPKEGMSVLDVGCGTGMLLELYQNEKCNTFGIDPSPSMLDVAKSRLKGRADLRQGDASDLPFNDQTFDLITTTMALHEMTSGVQSLVIEEIKRTLKEDGRFLIIDYHPGTDRSLKGWLTQKLFYSIEWMAGGDHFANFREFMKNSGLPALGAAHGLIVEKQKIIRDGNLGLFLLRSESGARRLTIPA